MPTKKWPSESPRFLFREQEDSIITFKALDTYLTALHNRLLTVLSDHSALLDGPMTLGTYTVSTLPSASVLSPALIYVSDEAGGAIPAFSDGSNWRRVSDRAVVS